MMAESLLDQADEAAGGFLTKSKKFLPFAARACLMASTLEDSWRYIREFDTYKTYISNVWMTDELEQDWLMANLFIWPLCLVRKIILQNLNYLIEAAAWPTHGDGTA
jgi:hypothetical protein